MLAIRNLHVSVHGKEILKGVSLSIKSGEIHVVMGPNGSGKSTLAYALMGHKSYRISDTGYRISDSMSESSNISREVAVASITFDGKDLSELPTDARARLGLFLAFQSPVAIPGVSVGKFLRYLLKLKTSGFQKEEKAASWASSIKETVALNRRLDALAEKLSIKPELLNRSLNDNFSGGEKKKLEALQMLVVQPKIVIVDEIDTGLDVDALKVVAHAVKEVVKSGAGALIITHYQRILKYLHPDRVHVLIGGKLVRSGDAKLARRIEEKGYKEFASLH